MIMLYPVIVKFSPYLPRLFSAFTDYLSSAALESSTLILTNSSQIQGYCVEL